MPGDSFTATTDADLGLASHHSAMTLASHFLISATRPTIRAIRKPLILTSTVLRSKSILKMSLSEPPLIPVVGDLLIQRLEAKTYFWNSFLNLKIDIKLPKTFLVRFWRSTPHRIGSFPPILTDFSRAVARDPLMSERDPKAPIASDFRGAVDPVTSKG
ncbi:hypothetical protein U1Q18_032101 [Sarracenia purpurea var. burkii]